MMSSVISIALAEQMTNVRPVNDLEHKTHLFVAPYSVVTLLFTEDVLITPRDPCTLSRQNEVSFCLCRFQEATGLI